MSGENMSRFAKTEAVVAKQLSDWTLAFSNDGSWDIYNLREIIRLPEEKKLTGTVFTLVDHDDEYVVDEDSTDGDDEDSGTSSLIIALIEEPMMEEDVRGMMQRLALFECPLNVKRCQECVLIVLGNNTVYSDGVDFEFTKSLIDEPYEAYRFPNLKLSFQ